MTLTIELIAEEEARLQTAARQQGIEPADVVVGLVRNLPDEEASVETNTEAATVEPMTWGARAIAKMEATNAFGAFDDRPEDSPELARLLRADIEKRIYDPW